MNFFRDPEMFHVLETRVLLPGLAKELVGDAQLFADIASEQVDIWQNPLIAQAMLNQAGPNFRARVLLLYTRASRLFGRAYNGNGVGSGPCAWTAIAARVSSARIISDLRINSPVNPLSASGHTGW